MLQVGIERGQQCPLPPTPWQALVGRVGLNLWLRPAGFKSAASPSATAPQKHTPTYSSGRAFVYAEATDLNRR